MSEDELAMAPEASVGFVRRFLAIFPILLITKLLMV